MTDDGILAAIEAELRRLNIGRGAAFVSERKREFIVEAIVGTEIRRTHVPEGATAAQVRKAIERLIPPPPARSAHPCLSEASP